MTINIRKNIARFIYIIDRTTNVDSRAKILKELNLTEEEFTELVGELLSFSNSPDKEWYAITPDNQECFIENFYRCEKFFAGDFLLIFCLTLGEDQSHRLDFT